MSEIWKAIPGFEGRYEVSNLGRVKSLDHTVMRKSGRPMPVASRILRGGKTNAGHRNVYLGGGHSRQVHELVLTTFVGPRPPGLECCHNDGEPTNNRLDNLRWDTRRSNIMDAIRKGSYFSEKRIAHNKRMGDKFREIREKRREATSS